MSQNNSYLVQERPGHTKHFSISKQDLQGKSNRELYQQDATFADVDMQLTKCVHYARAYTETILRRAAVEDPEIFAVKGISKEELS